MPNRFDNPYDFLPSNDKNRERAQQLQDAAGMDQYGDYLDGLTQGPFVDRTPVVPPQPEVYGPSDSELVKDAISRKPSLSLGSIQPTSADLGVKDAIKKKYGFGEGLDDKALLGAQQGASEDKFHANIGDAGSQLAYAIAGVQRPKDNFYDNLRQQAGQGVEDLKDRRKGMVEDQKFGKEQQLQDPNSPMSMSFKNSIKRLYPGVFKDEDLANISAADKDLVFDPLKLKEQIDARKETAKFHNDYLKQTQATKYDDAFGQNLNKNNKAYSNAAGKADSADQLIANVRKAMSNPANAASLSTELAGFASSGQRMHAATIEAFGHPDSSFMGRLKTSISKNSNGTLPPSVANEIVQYLQGEKEEAESARKQILQNESEKFKKVHGQYPSIYTPAEKSASLESAPGTEFNQNDIASEMKRRGLI